MLTKNIGFKSFIVKTNKRKILKDLKLLLSKNLVLLKSLSPSYKYSYSKKFINNFNKLFNLRIIGKAGSILGAEAIHDVL